MRAPFSNAVTRRNANGENHAMPCPAMVLTAVGLAVGSGVLRLTRPNDPVILVHEATMTHQHERADTAFRDLFGRQPQIATAAPGRVNLIGEHVDYCGGFVLPMAIERETVIVAARRTVVAGFVDRGAVSPPFDAVIDSTVSLGGGLSSSASLEVAVATLVATLAGRAIEPLEVALLCQQVEHEFAGVPGGVMDQCASALCVRDHLLLLDCRSLDMVQVPFNRPDLLVLVTNSNIRGGAGLSAGGRPRLHDVHDAAGRRSAAACMGGCQEARSVSDCVGTMFDAAPCVASDPPAYAEGLYGT
jgi:hypothetical protein